MHLYEKQKTFHISLGSSSVANRVNINCYRTICFAWRSTDSGGIFQRDLDLFRSSFLFLHRLSAYYHYGFLHIRSKLFFVVALVKLLDIFWNNFYLLGPSWLPRSAGYGSDDVPRVWWRLLTSNLLSKTLSFFNILKTVMRSWGFFVPCGGLT